MTDPTSDFFLDSPAKLDDPFADMAWFREHRPVYHHEPVDQWFVFPYDEVRSLFADKRMSANRMAGFVDAAPEPVRDELRGIVPHLEKWLLMRDGEDHSRLRTVLHRGFNANAIKAMQEPIQQAADELLDAAIHDHRLDVAADYAFLLGRPTHSRTSRDRARDAVSPDRDGLPARSGRTVAVVPNAGNRGPENLTILLG